MKAKITLILVLFTLLSVENVIGSGNLISTKGKTLSGQADITNNIIGTDQTICEGQTPAALTGTYPSGGDGIYVFLWESSTISATEGFSAASVPNNSQNYSPGSLNNTTWYRRVVTSDVYTNTSSTVQLTVNKFDPGAIMSDQTICEGSVPVTFTSISPTGTGVFTYQWQGSYDGATYFDIVAAYNEIYTPGELNQDIWYRREVTSTLNGNSCTEVTNYIKITVINFEPGLISADQTICEGSAPAPFTSVAPNGDGTFTYQWQNSADGVSFVHIAGATLETYAPPILTNTTWFNRIVTSTLNAKSCSESTNSIKVTVNPVAVVPTITGPSTSCLNTVENTYTTESGMSNYLWTVSSGGTITAGGSTNDNYVKVKWISEGAQSVSVNYTDSNSNTAPEPTVFNVTVSQLLVTSAITGNAELCSDARNKVYQVMNHPGSTYAWTVPIGILNKNFDGNLYFILVDAVAPGIGNIQVIETNSMGCTGLPVIFEVTVVPVSVAEVVAGPATVCQGDVSVVYSVPDKAGSEYSWLLPAGASIISDPTGHQIQVNFSMAGAGNISVTETLLPGCITIHAPIYVTINPLPSTPVITEVDNILTSSATSGNQWYLDNIPIAGATGQSFTATTTGDYFVIVTQNVCVSAHSNIIEVSTLTSVKETAFVRVFDVYPNPNSGRFIIRFEPFQKDEFDLEILNSKGTTTWKMEKVKVDGIFLTQLDLQEFSPGTYLIILSNKTDRIIRRIIITR
jgi:hypothetical protein